MWLGGKQKDLILEAPPPRQRVREIHDRAGHIHGVHAISNGAKTSIRCFETFTVELERLADWLRRCRIQTVAMESTGVYWIPLFQILPQLVP